MSVYFLDIPCVAEIEKIRNANVGSEKQYDSGLHALYKIHVSGEYAEYQGIFDAIPEDDESDYIVVPIESIFDGLYSVPEGTTYVNVIGSSQDHPSRGRSWLGFYELYSGESPYMCYTDGKLYYPNHSVETGVCNSFICPTCGSRKNFVGGHVVFGSHSKTAIDLRDRSLPDGSWVGIVPICQRHNMNNNNFMKMRQDSTVVKIRYILNKEIYQTLLEKARNEK